MTTSLHGVIDFGDPVHDLATHLLRLKATKPANAGQMNHRLYLQRVAFDQLAIALATHGDEVDPVYATARELVRLHKAPWPTERGDADPRIRDWRETIDRLATLLGGEHEPYSDYEQFSLGFPGTRAEGEERP